MLLQYFISSAKNTVYYYDTVGGVVVSGSFVVNFALNPTTEGGLVLSGNPNLSLGLNEYPNGGFVVSGNGGLKLRGKESANGGLVISGSGGLKLRGNESANGGLTLSGSDITNLKLPYIGNGELVVSGTDSVKLGNKLTSNGGLELSGSDDANIIRFNYESTGGLLIFGENDASGSSQSYEYTADNGLTLDGTFRAVKRNKVIARPPLPNSPDFNLYSAPFIPVKKCIVLKFIFNSYIYSDIKYVKNKNEGKVVLERLSMKKAKNSKITLEQKEIIQKQIKLRSLERI